MAAPQAPGMPASSGLVVWYGGTFDPVHQGHLAIARAASSAFGVAVTLAPAADPPHRAAPGASAAQRAHMLELAVAGDRRLRVDRRELQRPGPSWTVDTLHELRAELGPDTPLARFASSMVRKDSMTDTPLIGRVGSWAGDPAAERASARWRSYSATTSGSSAWVAASPTALSRLFASSRYTDPAK